MPIRPFLSGRAFEPETITEMSLALDRACEAMGLHVTNDIATELVAEKIVQLVERGVVGADELCSLAVKELTGRE